MRSRILIAAPTFSQIKAQVDAILKRSNGSKVIGIHAKGRWTGDRLKQDGHQKYLIEQCNSSLALRIALQQAQHEQSADDPQNLIQVLITPLEESDIAEDILLRLAKQRLFTIDPWQIVKLLFHATNIDPRLIEHRWIPNILMDWMPENRYAPVMGGFLDAEVIWPLLLQHGFHLKTESPDLLAILEWSTQADHVERYHQVSEDFRTAAVDWLVELSGPAARTILHCITQNQRPDALPLGLALEVICHPQAEAKLDKAIGKLEERFMAGKCIQPGIMNAWSTAARQTLTLLSKNLRRSMVQRSDEILNEIGAEQFAHLSSTSGQGFNQRLTELSKHLATLIKKPTPLTLNKLMRTYVKLEKHQQVIDGENHRRLERIQMSLRLAQWLVSFHASPPSDPKALEEAITYHVYDGSFLDWARLTLPIAEPHRELAKIYGKLFNAVTTIRETQALQFAKLLQDWTESGSMRKTLMPVEQILERVVSPLAATHPVLLVIVDGMSVAVCQELLTDLTQQNWCQITPENQQELSLQAGLAVIPSVTEFSRTSLLCGQLEKGSQNKEKPGFTKHPLLLQHCKRSAPPILFHKNAMHSNDASVLSNELYGAISSKANQVISLVINAVDDLLSKGDQVDIAWTCDRIKVLQPILQAARDAGRLVIFTSDHGHILHHGTKYKPPSGSERWRSDKGKPSEHELQLKGNRVLATDSNSVIVPWTEKLRYCTTKKNGYHGGINPQEVIVPIAILAIENACPKDWQIVDLSTPSWWKINFANENVGITVLNNEHPSSQSNLGPLFSYGESLKK